MGLSLIILLSWRGPWCIKWYQYHKAECDLEGDEKTLHMCKGIPTFWILKPCILNPGLLSPRQRKLFMLGKNNLTTVNFCARLLFPSSYFHILSFMSCHEGKQQGMSSYEWVLKSQYSGKSQRQSGCVTSAAWKGWGVSGHSISTHRWPACCRELLPWWGVDNGNTQHCYTMLWHALPKLNEIQR